MHATLRSTHGLWVGLALAALALPALARHYTIEDLSDDEIPSAINQAGDVAGYRGTTRANVFRGGHWHTLGKPDSRAFGINQQGDVVGDFFDGPMLWPRNAPAVQLPTPPDGLGAAAYAINGNRTVVGKYFDEAVEQVRCYAWRQDRGAFDLGLMGQGTDCTASAINGANQVAGWASASPGGLDHAFRYDEQNGFLDLGVLEGGTASLGLAIDEQGDVVGAANVPAGDGFTAHAFVYVEQQHRMFDLDPHGVYESSVARAINNRADVVGQVVTRGSHRDYAVRFGPDIVRLEDELVDRGDWQLIDAVGTADDGRIVGVGVRSDGLYHVFRLTPTGK